MNTHEGEAWRRIAERLNSIDTRFAGVLQYAEEHCGHSPLAGKPGEVTLMEAHQRLQVVVDKLSTMGDGVPITPQLIDTDVWFWDSPPEVPGEPTRLTVESILLMEHDIEFDGVDEYGTERSVDAGYCFSTREAAEAAEKARSDD